MTVIFKPSYVHQGHNVEIDGEFTGIVVNLYAYETIDGEFTGIVVNLYAYETIDDYKKQVDEKINNYIETL